MIVRLAASSVRPRLASSLPAFSPRSRAAPSSMARTITSCASRGVPAAFPSASSSSALLRTPLLNSRPALVVSHALGTQVRHHRTDYDGPGKYDERETGSTFELVHDHSHSHEHHDREQQQQKPQLHEVDDDDDEKEAMRQHLQARFNRRSGDYSRRGYTVGIGGPVGSGKTALTLALCQALRDKLPMGVVTNDIFTQEDAEFLSRNDALSRERIVPVETGGCPHAAIREDVSANLGALEGLTRCIAYEEKWATKAAGGENDEGSDATPSKSAEPLLLCESGGDNLAANFSSELADYTVYVIDVAGGDKVPRKGGPGITQSDLLVINKVDLAEAVGASLEVMERDAKRMRSGVGGGGESGPTIFASVKNGEGVEEIIKHIMEGYEGAHELVERAR